MMIKNITKALASCSATYSTSCQLASESFAWPVSMSMPTKVVLSALPFSSRSMVALTPDMLRVESWLHGGMILGFAALEVKRETGHRVAFSIARAPSTRRVLPHVREAFYTPPLKMIPLIASHRLRFIGFFCVSGVRFYCDAMLVEFV